VPPTGRALPRGARRTGREQRHQQLGGDLGVQSRAGLDEVPQAGVALDHHERPLALLAQGLRGAHHLAQHAVGVAAQERAEVARASELGEHVPQLGLEEDDEGDQPDGLDAVHDPLDRDQVEGAGEQAHEHDEQQPDVHLPGTRALHQHEQPVEEQRDEEDVEQVEQPDLVDRRHGRVSRVVCRARQ